MFKIKSLPARFGDSFWIEYGDQDSPHRMLIDGGTSGTRHEIRRLIQSLPQDQRHFDLLVVSHIDRDHIEGILGLLSEDDSGIVIEDIWFNGWPHLPENSEEEMFGAVQGERLTESILELDLPWNKSFGGKAIMIPDDGPLPQITLLGGLRLTLLSPTCAALADLRPKWEQEVRQANLDPGFGLDPNEDIESEEEIYQMLKRLVIRHLRKIIPKRTGAASLLLLSLKVKAPYSLQMLTLANLSQPWNDLQAANVFHLISSKYLIMEANTPPAAS